MRELDKVLNQDEKVLWEGTPSFWPFFLSRTLGVTIFGIFWMGFLSFFYIASRNAPGVFKYIIFMTPHFWIGIGMLFGPTIYNGLVFKYTYYAITDKRIIFQKGLIGRDFVVVDFNQIGNAEVNVGVFDKIFGKNTGSIVISTTGISYNTKNSDIKPFTMCNITDPYEVFKFLKKTSYDIKTDIEYPNKMRPDENPGYKTEYNPDIK